MIYVTLSVVQVDHLNPKQRGDLCRDIKNHLAGQFPHQADRISCCWTSQGHYRITSVESHADIDATVQQRLALS